MSDPCHADDDEAVRWSLDDVAVVIADQPGIRVYQNRALEIVIMRRGCWDETVDEAVFLRPEYLPKLIAALQRFLPK
jgi:hypothetical protein